jgi:hypothetical protein
MAVEQNAFLAVPDRGMETLPLPRRNHCAVKNGNQKHYQADPRLPIYEELCAIMSNTVGLAEPIRAALQPLADRIDAAFVFGSVAKKTDIWLIGW